ncbi:MAG: LPS export ABC transporter permease LptF [Alphaproteobacteria bacterium]|nr:LPS export ABC transporter permease LptF [Alphaproteobacteria bacterium]
MNRVSFYLFRQILLSVLFSCLAITIVIWFSQSIKLLALVINNGGSLWSFLKLMLLILPTFLPLVLPLSLMVGALFVYHRMIMESELVVMQASGMGPMALTMPALYVGVVVALIGYALSTTIAPIANHELVRLQYQIRDDHSILLLRTGSFNDIKQGLTFYARERGHEGEMRGILIHDTRKPEKPVTIMSESGELVHGPHGPQVLVKNGVRQDVDPKTGVLSQLTFNSYMVDLGALDDNFSTRWREPRERMMDELLNPDPTDAQPSTITRFLGEYHMRLTMPFLAITFVLISCMFILTGSFDRRGINVKITLAAITVIVLEATMLSVVNLITTHIWFVVGLYLIALLPIPIAIMRLMSDRVTKPAPMQQMAEG